MPQPSTPQKITLIRGMRIPLSGAPSYLEFYLTILGIVRTSLHFIHLHSLNSLTGTLPYSHLPLYVQSTISLTDLTRIAAMDGIAQRHVSIRENFFWFSKAHGDVWDGFAKLSTRGRHYFAYQYQVVWGDRNVYRDEEGISLALAEDYERMVAELEGLVREIECAVRDESV